MDYVIYTYGGGEILWKVFNGMALVFGQSNSFIYKLLAIGAGLGTLWAAASSTMEGGDLVAFLKRWVIPTTLILSLLFIPQTKVHIVDRVDDHFVYAPVDHVPIGLGLIASLFSRVSVLMTETFETAFRPVEATSLGSVGEMFPARLIELATDIRINDELARSNVKGFLNRCFWYPYLLGNLKGLKSPAKETEEIIEFVAAHPHSWMGTYWRDETGRAEFKSCRECVPLVREVMAREVPNRLKSMACKLFNWDTTEDHDAQRLQAKLSQYFSSGWQQITGQNKQAFDVIQQYIALNTFREGRDDFREGRNLNRLFPHLVESQSRRIQAQGTLASLIGANAAEAWLPSMQVALFALIVVLFAFIVPMTFVPGGKSILIMWVRLMMWVQIWPVFYAILNCLALMYLAKAGRATLMDAGGHLNIGSQYGLADQAFNIYGWLKGLCGTVPVIAWGVVSGSAYALTQLTSSASANHNSLAQAPAAEAVTGNFSYDNQSIGNKTMHTASIAKQSYGAGIEFGTKLSDGLTQVTMGAGGETMVQQQEHQLPVNFSASSVDVGSYELQVMQSQQAVFEKGRSFNEAENALTQSSLSLAHQVVSDQAYATSLSEQQNDQFRRLYQQVERGGSTQGTENAANDTTQANLGGKVELNAGIKGEKGLGILGGLLSATGGFSLGLDAGLSSSAQKQKIDKLANDYGWSAEDQRVFETGLQAIRSGNVEKRDGSSATGAQETRHNYERVQNASEELKAATTKLHSDQEMVGRAHRGELGSSINVTDQVVRRLAEQKFGGNIVPTTEWIRHNPGQAKREGDQILAANYGYIVKEAMGQMPPSNQIATVHNKNQAAVNKAASRISSTPPAGLTKEVNELNKEVQTNIKQGEGRVKKVTGGVNEAGVDFNNRTEAQIKEVKNEVIAKSKGAEDHIAVRAFRNRKGIESFSLDNSRAPSVSQDPLDEAVVNFSHLKDEKAPQRKLEEMERKVEQIEKGHKDGR